MAVDNIVTPGEVLAKQIEADGRDMLPSMVKVVALWPVSPRARNRSAWWGLTDCFLLLPRRRRGALASPRRRPRAALRPGAGHGAGATRGIAARPPRRNPTNAPTTATPPHDSRALTPNSIVNNS